MKINRYLIAFIAGITGGIAAIIFNCMPLTVMCITAGSYLVACLAYDIVTKE